MPSSIENRSIELLRHLFAVGALLVSSCLVPGDLWAEPAVEECTDAGCHKLDDSVDIQEDEYFSLLTALQKIDPLLADRISDQHDHGTPFSRVLDQYCLLQVSINPESRVKVDRGQAPLFLPSGAATAFLVKIVNLAGVTAPLQAHSAQSISKHQETGSIDKARQWLQIDLSVPELLPPKLTGKELEYRVIRLQTDSEGKRTAVIAMDVGQGTADIGFRNDVMLTFDCQKEATERKLDLSNARPPKSPGDLRRWLENMVWHHHYSCADIRVATGLSIEEIQAALGKWNISPNTRPQDSSSLLKLLPYPGGKHPRIGFLDGAVNPQRETKASVFTPWDPTSYVVLDMPEAIWSNLGLTYLAHTHVPTLWDLQNEQLDQLEWQQNSNGSLECERSLPNGVVFGTKLSPDSDAIHMEMWLTNGTSSTLTDLRVQNCVLLKFAEGFQHQTNDNKVFWGPYSACKNEAGDRWIISAWNPIHQAWGNADCPCLHSDPKFPDCPPGATQRLRGWLSFYEGTNIYRELIRIERTGWRNHQRAESETTELQGMVADSLTGKPIPARVHIQGSDGSWHLVESVGGDAVHYDRDQPNLPLSPEVHTTISADPFVAHLSPGTYTIRIERGKEYLPVVKNVRVEDKPLQLEFQLSRWINMAERNWYSGDTHVHRTIAELPNVMLAEDLNVALPLTYWVTRSDMPPVDANGEAALASSGLIEVDDTHVIYPVNTEYEIFSVGPRDHALGAVFVLNHENPLPIGVPPVRPVAELARQQGAILDLDKHSWPWSMMLVPIMDVDLFELSNNHVWQTTFGFKQWTLNGSPAFMQIERDEDGFTEKGWIDYGLQTYYTLLNCGFRLRVSAGTASGVHPVQLGFGRVYVHLPEGFSYERWIEGLNAGRSFVSTGPILDLKFNGHRPGHTFSGDTETQRRISVQGTAECKRPLDRIEIVVNGRVKETIAPTNELNSLGAYVSPVSTVVSADESYWAAVRCYEAHPEGRVRFAHTNPIFVDVQGHPVRPRKAEIAYLVQRMEEELESNRGVLSKEALQEYQDALAIYQEIAENAR